MRCSILVLLSLLIQCNFRNEDHKNIHLEESYKPYSDNHQVQNTSRSTYVSAQQQLIQIIKDDGDIRMIDSVINEGADINLKDSDGFYPLYWAKFKNHEQAIQKLIDLGAIDYNAQALSFFNLVKEGNFDGVRLSIQNGFDVNTKFIFYAESVEGGGCGCYCYETALYHAAESENEEMVKLLIDNGANVHLPLNEMQPLQPLEPLIRRGNYELMDLLLSKGSHKLFTHCYDNYSYYHEVFPSDTILLDYLIKHEFPYDSELHPWGESPLNIAVKSNDLHIIKKLLPLNFHADELGSSLCYSKSKEVAELLINNGADINYIQSWLGEGMSGETLVPLVAAIYMEDIKYVEYLLELGADPNILDKMYNGSFTYSHDYDYSPLTQAVLQGNQEIVKLLLEKKANVNFKMKIYSYDQDTVRWTSPLISAIQKNDSKMVSILLNYGVQTTIDGFPINRYFQENTSSEIKELLK